MRSLNKAPELNDFIEEGYEDGEDLEDIAEESKEEESPGPYDSRGSSRSRKHKNAEATTPDRESRLAAKEARRSKRMSDVSVVDVADRHLRDKTDAIAHIIRNISEQCAAAVEGLQLAHDAEVEAEETAMNHSRNKRQSNLSTITASDDGQSAQSSDAGDDGSLLQPSGRASSIPPTPDLIHNRSSTSMSIASSTTTTTPERISQQYNIGTDIPTKIVEDSDEELRASENEAMNEPISKATLLHRPAGARISALGGR